MSRYYAFMESRLATRVLLYCLAVFVLSRLLLELIGVGTRELTYPILQPDFRRAVFSTSIWLDIWGVWDTGWFLDIIEKGYDVAVHTEPGFEGQSNWAFFPLYPYLSKYLAAITGLDPFVAMLGVANLSFAGSLPVIWYETRHHYGEQAANLAVALIAFLPGSYIFSSAYSESLFLFLVMASLAFARRERWLLAGLAAALATLTRNLGVLLVLPILVQAWQAHGGWRDRQILAQRRIAVVVAVLLPAIALAGFMAFLWRHTGDPLAFASVQAAWKRELQNPLTSLIGPFLVLDSVQPSLTPSIAMAWISVFATGVLIARRNWPHAVFMIAVVTITLSSGILSYFRLFLTMAPGIMALAAFFSARPLAWPVALGLFAAANGAMMATWALALGIY
jgi:hypothetical protein